MRLEERKKSILGMVIEEYINEGEPISSKFLAKKYQPNLSPATIRLDLQKLTEEGYLYQPHTSAGRVPTNKGYRFFINELMKPLPLKLQEEGLLKNFAEKMKDDLENNISLVNRKLIRILSEISRELVMVGFPEQDEVYYEGISNLFQKPEFQEVGQLKGIFETMENFRNHLADFFEEGFDGSKIKVFVGKENPFCDNDDFSMIVSRFEFSFWHSEVEPEVFAILGPKRMRYNKNISLFSFLSNLEI